jgi:predicted nucleic acid-binding protein
MNEGVFLDASALYAVFDAGDTSHETAARAWDELLRSDAPLHTINYVALELAAVLQRRLGVDAVDALTTYVLPLVNVIWVDDALHAQGTAGVLAARRRDLSLVDCTSFAAMRRLGLHTVFSLDTHFAEQGFTVLPAAP